MPQIPISPSAGPFVVNYEISTPSTSSASEIDPAYPTLLMLHGGLMPSEFWDGESSYSPFSIYWSPASQLAEKEAGEKEPGKSDTQAHPSFIPRSLFSPSCRPVHQPGSQEIQPRRHGS